MLKPSPDQLCACLHCGGVYVADFLIPYDRKADDKKIPIRVPKEGVVFSGIACPKCNKNDKMFTSEYRMLYTASAE